MAFTRMTVDGIIHESSSGQSPSTGKAYVRLTLRQSEVRHGEQKTRWYTVFLGESLVKDSSHAHELVARFAKGRHVLAEGRPEFKLWAPGAVSAPNLQALQEQVRQDVLIFANSMPEVFP